MPPSKSRRFRPLAALTALSLGLWTVLALGFVSPAWSQEEDFEALPVNGDEPIITDPDELYEPDDNPLNPLGNNLERLVQTQINGDLWTAMLGDLPCLDPTRACVGELQQLAVDNNLTLRLVRDRIDAIEGQIAEARSRNEAAVQIDVFEPLLQRYLRLETQFVNGQPVQRGFFDNLLSAISSPLGAINEALSLIGIPLLRGVTQTNRQSQAAAIAISDLQVQVAQIEASTREIEEQIRGDVARRVIDFDATRREFQISQEIARRSGTQFRLLEIDYRFGRHSSQVYLNAQTGLDRDRAATFRAWARMRSELQQIQLLVLGVEGV